MGNDTIAFNYQLVVDTMSDCGVKAERIKENMEELKNNLSKLSNYWRGEAATTLIGVAEVTNRQMAADIDIAKQIIGTILNTAGKYEALENSLIARSDG